MSKKSSKPSTEIVHAGQPSAGLLAALKAAGAKLSDDQLIDCIKRVEAERVGFVVEAVAAGVLLLAKKQTLKHGEWQPYLAKVWQQIQPHARWHKGEHQSGNGVSCLPDGALSNFVRSLRSYTFLAQHFISDLEQGAFQPEAKDLAVQPPPVAPAEVLALENLPQEKRIAVYGAIERFVAGRSLRRMLIDFRRAECAADQEEIEEEDRRRKKAEPAADPAQLEMFDEFLRPLGELDTLFQDQSFLRRTDRAFWTSVADKLETQARRARQLAKEIKA